MRAVVSPAPFITQKLLLIFSNRGLIWLFGVLIPDIVPLEVVPVDFVDAEQLFCCGLSQPLLTGALMTEHYHGRAGNLMVSWAFVLHLFNIKGHFMFKWPLCTGATERKNIFDLSYVCIWRDLV